MMDNSKRGTKRRTKKIEDDGKSASAARQTRKEQNENE
jgi:hypothetical protein